MIRAAPRHVSRAHPATLPPRASLASPPRFATLTRGGGALAWLTPLPVGQTRPPAKHLAGLAFGQRPPQYNAPSTTPTTAPASLAPPPRFATLTRGGGALAWLMLPRPIGRHRTPLPLACSWRIGHHYGQPCGHSAAPPPSAGGALRRPPRCPTPTTAPASLASPPLFASLKRGGGALAWLTPLPLACSWRKGRHYGQAGGHAAAPPPSAAVPSAVRPLARPRPPPPLR